MSETRLKSPPATDQIEVTVFGPGVGECILIHAGHGNWFCIDCANENGRNWPLKYLSSLKCDIANNVKLVVATHWHADHVRGISDLVDACKSARFVASSAIRADEFKQLVARFSSDDVGLRRAPLGEVRRVFELLDARRTNGATYIPPELVNAHQIIDKFDFNGIKVAVTSLSPSAQDRINALQAFAGYLVPIDDSVTGLSPIDQNHASVVILVEINNERILLGADLETSKSEHCGWRAVVESTRRPLERSSIFKVPHHGSVTGQCDGVWNEMLEKRPIAVLTPYASAEVPTEQELDWLKTKTERVFLTTPLKRVSVRRRREVISKVKQVTKSIRSYSLPGEPGIVRLRKKLSEGAEWDIELFGSALAIG